MNTPTAPALASVRPRRSGRVRGLRSRLSAAKRRAAVVTSVALLAVGGSACTSAPTSDAPVRTVALVAAPAPPATLLPPPAPPPPPTVPIHLTGDVSEAGTPIEGGRASYYGRELAGTPTASGEPFDPSALTAAHRTLPLGTRVRVTHARTGESVVVRVNDRGPFHGDRVIDVSRAAADAIGLTRAGTAEVELERLPRTGGARG